jgi:(2S)-methylsuccinyl-CoA dehydrogenase
MPADGHNPASPPDIQTDARHALAAVDRLLETATDRLRARLDHAGIPQAEAIDLHQSAAHALAWLATYATALHRMQDWADGLAASGRLGAVETCLHRIAMGEYLAQIRGGIPMGQGEIARLSDLGVAPEDLDAMDDAGALARLARTGNDQATRGRLAALMADGSGAETIGATGLDAEYEMIRDQFSRFARERIEPHAQDWHLSDSQIPAEIIAEMAGLGVFGLTIPEEHGGFGMTKTAMCVVSEELSRGYIGAGSLGTRSEIAAELILGGGTDAQKARWLPRIASGEVLPTAVFTEPDTGSDLGALRTRAAPEGEDWRITGTKTWITHAARAQLMTVLARTDPDSADHRGLSMFLAEKSGPREDADFPDPGLTGDEIPVLGYRGMKEYVLSFDNFRVAGDGLLGGAPGQGFRQLMQTFESARIQTAARAVGVAQSALDAALRYAQERRQFGRPLIAFPRVAGKLAMMATEIMIARQLTYHAAAAKDSGRRCDLEAGMAKLHAARVAWSAADGGLQIHGGNGFALEYPISRILCDARVLNIFEGAAEIQAQVIARRLLAA